MSNLIHTYNTQITATGNSYQAQVSVTGAVRKVLSITLGASSSNIHLAVVLKTNTSPTTNIISLVLQSVSGDCTIKTNSNGSPADTVVMSANQILDWANSLGIGANPFPTADVTDLYLASTAGCTFNLDALVSNTNG